MAEHLLCKKIWFLGSALQLMIDNRLLTVGIIMLNSYGTICALGGKKEKLMRCQGLFKIFAVVYSYHCGINFVCLTFRSSWKIMRIYSLLTLTRWNR